MRCSDGSESAFHSSRDFSYQGQTKASQTETCDYQLKIANFVVDSHNYTGGYNIIRIGMYLFTRWQSTVPVNVPDPGIRAEPKLTLDFVSPATKRC